ncbi:hypothetical protein Tco_0620796 [Tanacetum coccineum]
MALAVPDPEPMHEDFIATVYPKIHKSLKHTTEEQVFLENPPSSSGTLSSMKNLDDAFTYVPLLSTLVIDLTQPKPVSPPIQEPIFTVTTTTTTTLPPPPPPQQQSTIDSVLASLDKYINENVKKAVQDALQAPVREHFRELSEFEMKEILHDRMFESGSYRSQPKRAALYDTLEASMDRENREEFMDATTKSRKRHRDDQDPPPPPPKDSDQNASSSSSNQKPNSQFEQPINDIPIPDDMHLSDSEDTGADHLPKIKTRPDWLKPIPEEETSKTPEPDWVIPLNDLPEPENNWADAIAKSYQDPEENKFLYKIDLTNPEGNRVVLDVSKPLPLGGPPGQVTIQPQYFFNKDLEYHISGDKDRRHALLISKLKAAYHQDFGLEELVPSLHSAPSDRRAVRSHMTILSVTSLKIFSRYGYTFLREIVLRIADYKEYKISEADFKNLHPNDFKDMYLLHLQGNPNHLSGADKIHLFNAVDSLTVYI